MMRDGQALNRQLTEVAGIMSAQGAVVAAHLRLLATRTQGVQNAVIYVKLYSRWVYLCFHSLHA